MATGCLRKIGGSRSRASRRENSGCSQRVERVEGKAWPNKIIETELGQKDLSDIVDYIVYSLENPSAAVALLDEVEACSDPYLKALGYRKVSIRNYIMIHKVYELTQTVSIMRFSHGRQNYEKLI